MQDPRLARDRWCTRRLLLPALALAGLGCGSASPAAASRSDAAAAQGPAGAGEGDDTSPPGSGPDTTSVDAAGAPQDSGAGAASEEGAAAEAAVNAEASVACGGSVFGGGPTPSTSNHLDIAVHDPSMAWDGARYYLFATGGTLAVRSSADILTWNGAGNVFSSIPGWITSALGSNPGSLWAPDISYFNGQFHVYYAGSTFGSNASVIGLATSASLASPRWTDQGLVVQSKTSDDFNAIDPNVSFDQDCTPWLAFGSFWSGIKLRKLDAATGKPATDDTTVHAIASRNGGAIEAASIVSHNGYYYLFVSFDACCKGTSSTYRTMVGRATQIIGPYTDKTGKDMMQGAAEQLLASAGRYIGPGGGTAWKDGSTYLYVFHYYDGDDSGNSKLQIRPIVFDASDWITLGDPLFP
ncbi:MAG TPA: arabinan endo-1,5-alpha-L-arabinosidase [Polyangiaceae bacterium]|nr:arabinan endo-1,5-alpha-L-arabinosidase [Polyangiaceae bacterium]